MYACENHDINYQSIEYLLKNNADPNLFFKPKKRALHFALVNKNINKNYDCVKCLLDHKALLSVNQFSQIPAFMSHKYSKQLFIVLFSQQDYLFKISNKNLKKDKYNDKILKLYKEYYSCKLWSIKRNRYFPLSSHMIIIHIFQCFKHSLLLSKKIFPRPLIHKIIQLCLSPNFNNQNIILI
eukprot:TRINITY_DN576_c0_g5_i1.p1 TRINITY_DN576_c0_g5~~TRINITY_DN576_c0_g5_i1.p1  ORF type:complete len:182 (+),score=45.78 TRINITY_DN576_c0_g5_i1:270-815(+)